MKRSYTFGVWWDGLHETDARNGYTARTDEHYAQFRIGRFHLWWGADGEDS